VARGRAGAPRRLHFGGCAPGGGARIPRRRSKPSRGRGRGNNASTGGDRARQRRERLRRWRPNSRRAMRASSGQWNRVQSTNRSRSSSEFSRARRLRSSRTRSASACKSAERRAAGCSLSAHGVGAVRHAEIALARRGTTSALRREPSRHRRAIEPWLSCCEAGELPCGPRCVNFRDMSFTIPLGLRERLTIGYDCGWWTMRWRKGRLATWSDDEPPSAGVREPLAPRLPTLGGEIALPLDDDDEFR
jgi:hypothetical protein